MLLTLCGIWKRLLADAKTTMAFAESTVSRSYSMVSKTIGCGGGYLPCATIPIVAAADLFWN